MKEKTKRFLKKNLWGLILILVILLALIANYTPGTWLIGWDTLHPEFNFLLNFSRLFNGVWRTEQGLGAVAGHSHIADLPRVILLFFSSFVLPISFLRYFYFFLTLILGPLGVYYFLSRLVLKDKPKHQKEIVSFLGGLFYFLNLGTLQHFYVPFEMFAALYAALPWLLLLGTKFLFNGEKRSLIYFSLATFLATPMAYAATLWHVYFLNLLLFLLAFWLFNSKNIQILRRSILLIVVTLLINSYWLLPNFYFLKTSADTVSEAKINQMFSQNASAHDTNYANLANASLLKGFLFDWQKYEPSGFTPLLDKWEKHLKNPVVAAIGYLLFGLVLFGIVGSLRKKEKFSFILLPAFLFSFIFLIYTTIPFVYPFNFLRDNSSLFKEGLRFPWTKFSIFVIFGYSFYFAQAAFLILNFFKNRKINFYIPSALLAFLLVVWMWPVFSGNLIRFSIKNNLPHDYQELFAWSQNQPADQRIAEFPLPTFWGWMYYGWGFEGAGFDWFGLKQPVLARDFDRWSPENENYYWEMSYALYSKNLDLMEKILEKYQIKWLLLDENIINPASPGAVYTQEFKDLVASLDKITLAQDFGKIQLYEVNLKTPVKNFVFVGRNLPNIGPVYNWNNYDRAYLENGNYLTSTFNLPASEIYYPFRSIFTGKEQNQLEFRIFNKGDSFVFQKNLPNLANNHYVAVPEIRKEDLTWIDPNNLSHVKYLNPDVYLDDQKIEVPVPKINGYFSAQINPATDEKVQSNFNESIKLCNSGKEAKVSNEIIQLDDQPVLRLKAVKSNNCSAAFWLPNLDHKMSYLITVKSRHLSGNNLLFWLENPISRKADIETYLPRRSPEPGRETKASLTSYFIQPPMEINGLGYMLHFDNISLSQQPTINDLIEVTVNPIPYDFLTGLSLKPTNEQLDKADTFSVPAQNQSSNLYRITIDPPAEKTKDEFSLILSQSYNDGWQAYKTQNFLTNLFPFFGQRLEKHFLVNNWENGWTFDPNQKQTITLIFWPQYLEYFGFLLLLFTPIIVWRVEKWLK